MGFSKKIKEDALIATARRCCVCKEFSGRNIEIHHIIHQNEGGENTFENAIPLCFDCHANAGHYNSKHPRGMRFAPVELRRHRDNWYDLVKKGTYLNSENEILQNYFVCNSFETVWEIINGDFENFPIQPIKVIKNELFNYLKSAAKFHKNKERELTLEGSTYKGIEGYLKAFPNVKPESNQWNQDEYKRGLDTPEIIEKISPNDFVTNYLVNNGASPNDIAKVEYIEYGCAAGSYENYYLRPAKVVFLSLTNSSNESIFLTSLEELKFPTGGFVELNSISTTPEIQLYNDLVINAGESVVVPICISLFPFDDKEDVEERMTYTHLPNDKSQDLRKVNENSFGNHPTIGPRNKVITAHFNSSDSINQVEIRPVDLANLLLISRFWEFGSCPHMFGKQKTENKWIYLGELFSSHPNKKQHVKLDLALIGNTTFSHLKIIELEQEITILEKVTLDNKVILKDIKLSKGEEIVIDISDNKTIEFHGHYNLIENVNYIYNDILKEKKIRFYGVDLNAACRREANIH
jgi:hypothetical protein